jgi:hypothetical protein
MSKAGVLSILGLEADVLLLQVKQVKHEQRLSKAYVKHEEKYISIQHQHELCFPEKWTTSLH